MQGLSNSQIAQIYADMMSGDKSALFKLQNVNSPHQRCSKPPTAASPSRIALSEPKQEIKEVTSMPSMPASKEELFLNAIKQGAKFTPLRNQRQNRPKHFRIVNSTNETYSEKDKTLFRDKQSKEVESYLPDKPKINKKPYVLPRVHQKPREQAQMLKVQSTHLEPMNKQPKENIEKKGLQQLQKSKISLKKEKVDFKEIIGKNKKLREQFERLNQEQRQLQSSILEYHNQTKDELAKVTSKFSLNLNNRPRYLRKRKSQSPQLQQSQSQKKLSPFKAAMKSEGERCSEIEAELAHLKSMFSNNDRRLRQLERERESFLFVKYLQRYGMEIMEEEQEEEDTVEPLQQNRQDRNHYKYSMAKTREKKWSLIQRIQYDAQRTHSLEERRQVNSTNRTSKDDDNSINHVTVNQRLKNLLFS